LSDPPQKLATFWGVEKEKAGNAQSRGEKSLFRAGASVRQFTLLPRGSRKSPEAQEKKK